MSSVATIGHNGGPALDDEERKIDPAQLEGLLRRITTLYNRALHDKRNANEALREATKKFNEENADFVRGIDETIRTARDELREERESRVTGFSQFSEDKKDAARRMREALKEAKDAGIDVSAFKKVLQMSAMDPIERQEHFDAIDQYCNAVRLWGGTDFERPARK